MYTTPFDRIRPLKPTAGLPKDLMNTPINYSHYKELYKSLDVQELILTDDLPIPATEDREEFYGPRHIEYWLSGYSDTTKLINSLKIDKDRPIVYLDFGGGSGRICRHITRLKNIECWMCDINAVWIQWAYSHFTRPIKAFQNRPIPTLPFESCYFDIISAFSVFTHLSVDEIPWLLELRRITKPGGFLFLTILDKSLWERIKRPEWSWLKQSLAKEKNLEYLESLLQSPMPERLVLKYSEKEAYNCNTFLSQDYIEKRWGAFFKVVGFVPEVCNYQTAVVLEKN